ncbi:MAG: hypothetical protein Q9166_002680 [cf. Caloplaca sp. 2 TL-2023]
MSIGAHLFSRTNHPVPLRAGNFFDSLLKVWRPPFAHNGVHKLPGPLKFGPNKKTVLRSSILTLEWPPGVIPSKLKSFETEARGMRYRALGKACHEANIPNLLLGHHEADQKETLIMRLIEGYRGEGLRGIPPDTDIANCQGIYGAYQSGGRDYTTTQNASAKALALKRKSATARAREMLPPVKEYRKPGFEYGGVRIYRPLLNFRKSALEDALSEAQMPWVTDPTNHDPTLSIRNTIRFLIRKDLLPKALTGGLRTDGNTLEIAARRIRAKFSHRNDYAQELFQACHIVSFDSRSGRLHVRIPRLTSNSAYFWSRVKSQWTSELEHIGARVVRLLLHLVTPQDHISLQSLEVATKSMFFDFTYATNFPPPGHRKNHPARAAFTAGGVYCERVDSSIGESPSESNEPYRLDPEYTWHLSRQPYHLSLPEPECTTPPARPLSLYREEKRRHEVLYPEPPWQLWDGRYWIQVLNPTPKPLKICPLSEHRLLHLRAKLGEKDGNGTKKSASLQQALRVAAPGLLRFTIPAIVDGNDNVLILPTLNFEVEETAVQWRIRYRRVIFPDNIETGSVMALPEKELKGVRSTMLSNEERIMAEKREAKAERKIEERLEKQKKKEEEATRLEEEILVKTQQQIDEQTMLGEHEWPEERERLEQQKRVEECEKVVEEPDRESRPRWNQQRESTKSKGLKGTLVKNRRRDEEERDKIDGEKTRKENVSEDPLVHNEQRQKISLERTKEVAKYRGNWMEEMKQVEEVNKLVEENEKQRKTMKEGGRGREELGAELREKSEILRRKALQPKQTTWQQKLSKRLRKTTRIERERKKKSDELNRRKEGERLRPNAEKRRLRRLKGVNRTS